EEHVEGAQLTSDLGHRPVGDPVAVRNAAAEDAPCAVEAAEELGDEPRLPHSGCPDDRDEPARAGVERLGERVTQSLQLRLAPDHRRRGEPARLFGADLAQLPGRYRLALALQVEVGDPLRYDGVADALDSRLSE